MDEARMRSTIAPSGRRASSNTGYEKNMPAAPATEPATRDTKARVAAGDGGRLASTSATASTSSGSTLGKIFNWRVALVVILVFGLTIFLLRRRAVRRQRKRRLERMKRMDEIKRRRMIDLVEPADELGHVRVVTPRRSAG